MSNEEQAPTKESKTRRSNNLWTPANKVTMARIVLVPIWLLIAELSNLATTEISMSAFITFLLFVVLSLTDKLDGFLARKRNEVTTFGKFLDPIADKLVVVVCVSYLVEVSIVSSWVLLIIVAREFIVSGVRMVVAKEGVVIAASSWGKAKTATTMTALSLLLLARVFPVSLLTGMLYHLGELVLLAALVLTIWSGYDYLRGAWPYLVSSSD